MSHEPKRRDDKLDGDALEGDGLDDRGPVFRVFGAVDPGRAWILFFALAFFPPSLAAVGAAVAYELTAELWTTAVGLAAGAGLGLLLARDFVNWRLRPVSIAGALGFAGMFALAYW